MTTQPQTPDLGAIKERQQKAWSSGDYGKVGVTLVIIAERLCEAADLRSGQQVLDRDLIELIGRFNSSGDETAVVPSDYLEVVAIRG